MKLNRALCLSLLILALLPRPAAAQQAPAPPEQQQPSPEQMQQEWAQASVWSLDLTGVPAVGTSDAPIKVVEFADYLCGACRHLARVWSSYLPNTGGRVAVYYKQYPLDLECNDRIQRTLHPGACWLALGALCAAEQNRFEPYNEKAFSTDLKDPKAADVVELGTSVGLDGGALAACLQSPETTRRLKAQIAEAADAGVKGTPTVFLNGKRLPQINYFAAWLDAEARRLGLAPAATH